MNTLRIDLPSKKMLSNAVHLSFDEHRNNEVKEHIELGQKCQLNDVCAIENSICLEGFCQCDYNYVQAGMVLCLTRLKSDFLFEF